MTNQTKKIDKVAMITRNAKGILCLWIDEYDIPNRKAYHVSLTRTQREEYEIDGAPFMYLTKKQCQNILDSLVELGYKPSK